MLSCEEPLRRAVWSCVDPARSPVQGSGGRGKAGRRRELDRKGVGESRGPALGEPYLHTSGAVGCPLAMPSLRKLRRATQGNAMHGFSGKPRGFCCGSQGTGRPSAGRPSSRASSASSAGFSAATSQGRGEGQVLTPSARCQAFVLVTPAPGTCWVQRVGGTCFGRRWGWGRSAEFDLRQAGATEEEAEGGGSGWLFGANAGPQTFG